MPALQEVRKPRSDPYRAVHDRLRNAYGRASEHQCACGEQAAHWAYQYTGDPELYDPKGRPYSNDMACYLPMCAKCHMNFDLDHDPKWRETKRRVGAEYIARIRAHPEHVERMRAINSATASLVNRKRRRCNDCGMISSPAALGVHLSVSGHSGYED